MYAGGLSTNNSLYYLYNGQNYWTMTPGEWYSTHSYAQVFYVHSNGSFNYGLVDNTARGLRPVINLRSDITVTSGNGTLDNPYVVQ